MHTTRRQFIKTLAALTAALSVRPGFAALPSARHMRSIPSSGEKIPAIGLGSWLTFAIDLDDREALAKRIAILR